MILSGDLADCEALYLEVENDPRAIRESTAQEYTLALLWLYDHLSFRMRGEGWDFRIGGVPGSFAPHQTYRQGSRVGGELTAVLAMITRRPQESMSRDDLLATVRWLWEDLYVYRYGEVGHDRDIYAAYLANCVKLFAKTLPASIRLLRYAEFQALIPPAVKSAKGGITHKVGGLA